MDNLDEKTEVTAEPAEAEKEFAAAVPSKFESVETLSKAYQALEAEFTRRSQRLKELEKENKALASKAEQMSPSPEEYVAGAAADERVKNAVLGEYLKTVTSNRGVPLVTVGNAVAAPRVSPKTVKEAGKLATQFLNK